MSRLERTTSRNYTNPHRPLPIKMFNRFGGLLGKVGLSKPMTVDSLIAAAQKRAKLRHFGDESFREPLARLLVALETEARLSPMGEMIAKTRMVGILANRLRVQSLVSAHPEILDEKVRAPIVITGLQRTGTTMLHRLLAADPGLRSLRSWEALNPAPMVKGWFSRKNRRIKAAQTAEKGLAYLAPDFFAIHPVEAQSPEEEVMLLDHTFLSTVAEASFSVPSYSRWLEQQDQTPAYEYLKVLLQLLQWQNRGQRWVLKTPHHLEWLDTLLDVFPDVKVVQTHRDPARTLASFCSMIAHGRGIFSDRVDPVEVGHHWLEKIGRMLSRSMQTRDQRGSDWVIDVSYYDLIDDWMPQVERIYDFVGRDLSDPARAAMQSSRKKNRQHKYGKHVYDLADFGLTTADAEPYLARYRARFGIRHES